MANWLNQLQSLLGQSSSSTSSSADQGLGKLLVPGALGGLAGLLVIPGHGFDWFEDLRFRIVMLPEPQVITQAMEQLGDFLERHRR